jgi:hypothetical protein
MRVGALLRRRGQAEVDDWYAAVGHAFHIEGRKTHESDVHRALLDELGVGADVVDEALADPTTGTEVRDDHDWVVGEKGAFGVPTLIFPDGQALFGPVVAPAPEGDEAVRLWDLTLGWRDFPHLYEIKRPKSTEDQRHIAGVFKPYLGARAWPTIERPAR